jgi:tetratricopeptide (TPR) repeat protein
VLTRHVDYYAKAVSEWFEKLKGPEQYPTLTSMEHEIGNLRFAFQTAAASGASEQLRRLSEGLYWYYDMRTLLTEAETVFEAASQAYRNLPDRDVGVDAFLRIAAGYFAVWDRPGLGAQRKADGMKLLPETTPQDRLHAMANVIYAAASFGREREANGERIRKSLAFFRERNDLREEAVALASWATVEMYHDNDHADLLAQQGLRLHRDMGDRWSEGIMLHLLARLAESRGELELALKQYQEAQRLNEPFTADAFGVLSSLICQARVTGRLGRTEDSMRLAEQALRLSRETGYRLQIGRSLLELARASRSVGDAASAKTRLEEAFALLNQRQWGDLQATCARMLSELALDESDLGTAAHWLREASMLQPDDAAIPLLSLKLEQLRERSSRPH